MDLHVIYYEIDIIRSLCFILEYRSLVNYKLDIVI